MKLRAGLVRCGACKEIFNGIEHLVPPNLIPAPHPSPRPVKESRPIAASVPLPDKGLPPNALRPPAEPGAGGETALPAYSDLSIDHLEFVPVDDPETKTRILSGPSRHPPSPQASHQPATPAEEPEEDPLTRMTLVDFTQFDEYPATPATDSQSTIASGPADPVTSDQPEQPVPAASGKNPSLANAVADTAPVAPAISLQQHALRREPFSQSDSFADAGTDAAVVPSQSDDLSLTEEPDFVIRDRRRQRVQSVMRILMALACVLLLLGALVQGTYAFRNQLAARFPQSKPFLLQFCEVAGCNVSLPAQIDLVSLESSTLEALATDKNVFALTLLLHNRSQVAQTWPHIELTLNDSNEKPLVRRVLTPTDYLPADQEVARGFSAQSELPVKLAFELLQVQASGYRVYLFYP